MRTRSVQLVTSWWVVGVWAALGVATGVISVVAVLQPAWYVRYSHIYAQDASGVSFQVMVSSVGPLGYCRLAGVSQVTVTEEETRQQQVTPPTGEPYTTPDRRRAHNRPSPTGASNHQPGARSPAASPGPPSPTSVHSQGWPPEGGGHTTLAVRVVHGPYSPAGRIVGAETGVSSDGRSTLGATGAAINTDKSAAAGANRSEEILPTVEESFTTVNSSVGGEENFKSSKSNDTTISPKIPKRQTPLTETAVVQEGEQGRDEGRREGLTPSTTTTVTSVPVEQHNATQISWKRKGKHRRKKKKNKRKRPRRRKGKKAGGGSVRGSQGHSTPPPPPPPPRLRSQPLQHLLRSQQGGTQEQLVASPLRHFHPQQENLTDDTDYRPRPPILYCSGVGGGVGSGSSAVWALVGVLYGVAGVVQAGAGVASLALHFPHARAHTQGRKYTLSSWLGNVQVAVVMSQGVALVLFPLGLGSPLARGECGGSSSVYWPGECCFGWSYMLGVVATTLAAYCPCLARLTVFRRYGCRDWDSINFF